MLASHRANRSCMSFQWVWKWHSHVGKAAWWLLINLSQKPPSSTPPCPHSDPHMVFTVVLAVRPKGENRSRTTGSCSTDQSQTTMQNKKTQTVCTTKENPHQTPGQAWPCPVKQPCVYLLLDRKAMAPTPHEANFV